MPDTVILDFLSDSMGGLLTSARAFLNRVRAIDADTRLVVLEEGDTVSRGVTHAEDFEWVRVQPFSRPRAIRRMAWQNLMLPAVIARQRADIYLSLSHFLPHTLPHSVSSIVGISNLAPFSPDALVAEVRYLPRLRLRLLRQTILSAARRADRVVALSEAGKQLLANERIATNKIRVIPNGVAPAIENPSADAAVLNRLAVQAEFILCVSHFYRYKNFARLVHAYALLPDALRARHLLVLVGAPYDPAYFLEIETLVKRLGLSRQVRLVPGVYGEDLHVLYRQSALFVFPSLIENSPITLLEALMHGAVVAAADIPAMREFAGDAAVYFDPHSAQGMANTMMALLDDPSKRAQLRALGPRQASRYTWDDFTAALVDVYRELRA